MHLIYFKFGFHMPPALVVCGSSNVVEIDYVSSTLTFLSFFHGIRKQHNAICRLLQLVTIMRNPLRNPLRNDNGHRSGVGVNVHGALTPTRKNCRCCAFSHFECKNNAKMAEPDDVGDISTTFCICKDQTTKNKIE